jgi:hypothetical protein
MILFAVLRPTVTTLVLQWPWSRACYVTFAESDPVTLCLLYNMYGG